MSFFGITQFGPQSPMAAHRKQCDEYTVSLFALAEFSAAFDRVSAGASSLAAARVGEILGRVYRGPAPPRELALVEETLAAHVQSDGSITRAAFIEVIDTLQRTPRPPVDLSLHAHYTSFEEFRAHRLLERRPLAGPPELDVEPRTASAEIGFEAHKAKGHKIHCVSRSSRARHGPSFPQTSSHPVCTAQPRPLPDVQMSDITKFKSDLIKAGVDYV